MKDDTISRQGVLRLLNAVPSEEFATKAMLISGVNALPSAEPECEDTISRSHFDERVRLAVGISEEELTDDFKDGVLTVLEMLRTEPPVTPKQPGWIPWDSGRFPEESGTYTVTAYDGATKRVTYAKYQKRLKRWELTGARAYWRVLAWMPHIEPWEGRQG